MDNKTFGKTLETRTPQFAVAVIQWCSASVLQPLIDECSELLALLTPIRSKLKNK
jgi:hypothetical protein